MAQLDFNAATVDPQGDRSPAPAGDYKVVVVGSTAETAKSGQGKKLALQMRVIEGDLTGKVIFQNINYLHSNPTAQEIGQSQLSALCHSVGVLQIRDSQQLHGIPLVIAVTVDAEGKYNEVTAYKRADGQPLVKGQAGGGVAPTAAPAWAAPQGQAPAPQPQAPVYQQPAAPVQPQQPQYQQPQYQQPQAPAPVYQQPAPQPQPVYQQPQPQAPIPQAQPPQAWTQPQAPAPAQQPVYQQPAQQQQAPAVTPPWVKQPGA